MFPWHSSRRAAIAFTDFESPRLTVPVDGITSAIADAVLKEFLITTPAGGELILGVDRYTCEADHADRNEFDNRVV